MPRTVGVMQMNADKMHVMLDIKDEFRAQGKDHNAIADVMHKEKSVVDKQLSAQNGTQTLLTAYGYAEAAGGRIMFMRDEEWERMKSIEQECIELRESIKEHDRIIAGKADTEKVLTAQIQAQTAIIQRLEKQIDDKEDSIRRKEAVIARKDGVIAELLRKAGAIG